MTTTLTPTEKKYSKYIGGLYFDKRFCRLLVVEKVAKRSYTNAFYVTYRILNTSEQKTKDKMAIDFDRELGFNIVEVVSQEHYEQLCLEYKKNFGIIR